MDFEKYQELADLTDQFSNRSDEAGLMIPLLGLAGETGTLLSEFKKHIRDKESYEGFKERAKEELGDVLWYLSNLASRLELSLAEVAAENLRKTEERWPIGGSERSEPSFFDEEYPKTEQLPRQLKARIYERDSDSTVILEILPEGKCVGDPLTDNAYRDDGYRFHDVMHLAHMAVLGWSPIMRRFLGCKRKSNPTVDNVEDGARAGILEELIVAFVYSNAQERRYYDGIQHVDTEMLTTIKRLVRGLEVGRARTQDWERAILQGYTAFRYLLKHKECVLTVDMESRSLEIAE